MDDLCIICPNGNWRAVVSTFLERAQHLGIRDVTAKILVSPLGESRYLSTHGPKLASLSRSQFGHCLLLVDGDRCEQGDSAVDLEASLNAQLKVDWAHQGRAIVADPCLEGWLLEGHRAFGQIPGLRGVDVRRILHDSGIWPMGSEVPDQPRQAMEYVFRQSGLSLSAANYRRIARHFPIRMDAVESGSLRSFIRLLRGWFMP
ncbi:MAG: hypothetical protein VX589_12800 [Myxococcota bacterium]|nr:hypothetical protein [Myxococcota bacterium]